VLAEGATVHAVSRSGTVSDAAMHGFAADLSDPAGLEILLGHLPTLGGIDILVANTGGPRPGPAMGVAPTDWVQSFEALALPLFRIADAVLPGMIERGWGRIVTIGSSGIEQPIPGLALSNAIRGSVAGWSKTLAAEVAPHGVTVNMVLPGRIDTDRVRELDGVRARNAGLDIDAVKVQVLREIPAGRYGEADEFGAVVAFLAGRPAAYVTGSMLRVDGGLIRSL
jgi:3-oxoacyl-[acyl-carrier protein] reductase